MATNDVQSTGSTVAITSDDVAEPVETNPSGEIVVTAERIRGSVDTDVPPVEELNEADIAAVGASSLTDLVAAVAPQANSGRGRGGGLFGRGFSGRRLLCGGFLGDRFLGCGLSWRSGFTRWEFAHAWLEFKSHFVLLGVPSQESFERPTGAHGYEFVEQIGFTRGQ